jgi:hypothetical protein
MSITYLDSMMARIFLRPSKAFGRRIDGLGQRIDGLSQRIDNVERCVTELDARSRLASMALNKLSMV